LIVAYFYFTSDPSTKEGHVLFSIPRNLTLSTRTSSFPSVFGLEAWKNLKLHEGWSGLILSMIWEVIQGSNSRWAEYLSESITFLLGRIAASPNFTDILPTSFDTPMFWDEKDLSELLGTSIIGMV
jgi:SET domain-containing protein 6